MRAGFAKEEICRAATRGVCAIAGNARANILVGRVAVMVPPSVLAGKRCHCAVSLLVATMYKRLLICVYYRLDQSV